jgi:two-component system, cell cycle response regulator
MTARILVVDDVAANVRLLEVRLVAEYFEVVTASSGAEALEACENGKIDVVLLDVMMPGMDGFEVCRRLKADPATAHIPVVMVTALDQAADRVKGLEAGADDFLTKPVNDLQLMTRVKSLVRLKVLTDELRLRAATTRDIGIEELLSRRSSVDDSIPNILLVEQRASAAERMRRLLRGVCEIHVCDDPQAAFFKAADGGYECVIVSTDLDGYDPLRLCSQIRSLDRTRYVPIILLAGVDEEARLMRGLDLGVNDFLTRPIDKQELIARIRTQVRRKRYNDHLRASLAETIEMAVVDGLTGLHNRRYLDSHLATLVERARGRGKPLSLMITDIDRFKSINDTLGHDAGDDVLREFAARLRKNVRGIDLACRMGGEEFVVVMPETDGVVAEKVAERIRAHVAAMPFKCGSSGKEIEVTVSVGVAALSPGDVSGADILKRADVALYAAKNGGRNRVVADAA